MGSAVLPASTAARSIPAAAAAPERAAAAQAPSVWLHFYCMRPPRSAAALTCLALGAGGVAGIAAEPWLVSLDGSFLGGIFASEQALNWASGEWRAPLRPSPASVGRRTSLAPQTRRQRPPEEPRSAPMVSAAFLHVAFK